MTDDQSDQDSPRGESTADSTADSATGSTTDGAADVLRRQSFTLDGTAALELSVGAGRVSVRFGDEPGVHVEIAHDPSGGSPWTDGLSGLMNWVSDQVGQLGQFGAGSWGAASGSGSSSGFPGSAGQDWFGAVRDPGAAVRECRLQQHGNRIVLRGPDAATLKAVPLAVTVQAPAGSALHVQSAAATVTTTGQAGEVTVESGTGDVTVGPASGTVRVQTASGRVRLGPTPAGIRARTGTGDVEVASVGETSNVLTASGAVRLGVVQADVVARTGSGDLRVDEAARGRLELVTGSGEIRVGVRAGVAASIDLVSHSGAARSELPVTEVAPDGAADTLTIRGRTASGTAVVTAAG